MSKVVVNNTTRTVTVTSTGKTGPVGLNWRGEWAEGVEYQARDAVYHDGSSYRCVEAHTSNEVDEPGASDKWQVIALGSDVEGVATVAGIAGSVQTVAENAGAVALAAEKMGAIEAAPQAATDANNAAERAETAAQDVEGVAAVAANLPVVLAAPGYASAAAGSAATASAQADRAEAAAGNAFVNANVYPDVATGRAAVADGEQFQVLVGDEYVRYRRDSASTQTEVGRYPSSPVVKRAQLDASETALAARRGVSGRERPKAAVVVLLGQSLNAPWSTAVETKAAPIAKIPVGGLAITTWGYNTTNAEWTGNWSELASAVDFTEGVGQTPASGIVNALAGSKYSRVYVGDAAIGARSLQVLTRLGPITSVNAILHRFCQIAHEDGYDPEVMFYTAHGEANAAAATSENDYFALGMEYYGKVQLYAAQAMQKPGYLAPVVFTYPNQTSNGDAGQRDIAIKAAIKRIAEALPNAINLGPIYQWPMGTDRVHPLPASYVLRGEAVGKVLKEYTTFGSIYQPLRITDVRLDGTEFVATFSEPVARDDTTPFGQNLNTSYAKDGFEWVDNGSFIAISSLTYEGWKVRGALASEPSGTMDQQVLRVASQATAATLANGPEINAGSLIRAQSAGWPSIYNPSYINYKWAMPQSYNKVRQG